MQARLSIPNVQNYCRSAMTSQVSFLFSAKNVFFSFLFQFLAEINELSFLAPASYFLSASASRVGHYGAIQMLYYYYY